MDLSLALAGLAGLAFEADEESGGASGSGPRFLETQSPIEEKAGIVFWARKLYPGFQCLIWYWRKMILFCLLL